MELKAVSAVVKPSARHLPCENTTTPYSCMRRTLSSPQNALAAEWVSTVGLALLNLNPLGSWMKVVWARTGTTGYLDLAAKYALNSVTAFRLRGNTSSNAACLTGERALQSLQRVLCSHTRDEVNIDLCVAITLHYAAEVSSLISKYRRFRADCHQHFRGLETCFYVPHLVAISGMLATNDPGINEDEIFQSMIRSTREDEV